MNRIIILSGGFDPVHIGHIRMFKAAKETQAKVIVGVNSDEWLSRKKGQPFMAENERIEILNSCKYIDSVINFDDSDGTACNLIKKVIDSWKGTNVKIFFGNGGDRTSETTPEIKYCKDNNIEMLWGLGGNKIQSSSELTGQTKK
tara:strand:+ start:1271 stop:1705 length:435 start_codon:yes stop_codon:yes gene_type:complete